MALVLLGLIIGGVVMILAPDSDLESPTNAFAIASRPISLAATLVFWAWVASLVDYRWRDALFLLIPFYGIYWSARMAWRAAALPQRPWPAHEEPQR